jgi:hypothetical protein
LRESIFRVKNDAILAKKRVLRGKGEYYKTVLSCSSRNFSSDS